MPASFPCNHRKWVKSVDRRASSISKGGRPRAEGGPGGESHSDIGVAVVARTNQRERPASLTFSQAGQPRTRRPRYLDGCLRRGTEARNRPRRMTALPKNDRRSSYRPLEIVTPSRASPQRRKLLHCLLNTQLLVSFKRCLCLCFASACLRMGSLSRDAMHPAPERRVRRLQPFGNESTEGRLLLKLNE